MRNGTPRGDQGRPLQMMDAGSTCLGSYTRGHAAPDLLSKQLKFPALGKVCSAVRRGIGYAKGDRNVQA